MASQLKAETRSLKVVHRSNGTWVFRVMMPENDGPLAAIDIAVSTIGTNDSGGVQVSLVPSTKLKETAGVDQFYDDVQGHSIQAWGKSIYDHRDPVLPTIAEGYHIPVIEAPTRDKLPAEMLSELPKIQTAFGVPDSVMDGVHTVVAEIVDTGFPEQAQRVQDLAIGRLKDRIVTVPKQKGEDGH